MSSKHRRYIILFVLLLASFYLSINFNTSDYAFIPRETFVNLTAWIKVTFRSIFDSRFVPETVTDSLPFYAQTVARVKMSLIALFSGIAVCLGGAVFQTVFKNPIASPNLLGISTGVSLGNIVFVVIYQLAAMSHLTDRYFFCYGFAAILLMLTFSAGKLANRKTAGFSIETMIIIGMMVSQLGGVFMTYFQSVLEGDETGLAEIYTAISSGNLIYVDNVSLIVFAVMMGFTILPMLLIRYRFNLVAFEDAEVKTMGISNNGLRFLGLLLGSLMATAAMIHSGEVGLLSMAVPFMCRKKLHAEFGEVAITSVLVGGILTLVSRTVFTFITSFGFLVPSGTILTLVLLPVFVYSLIKRESAFA